MSGKVGGWGKVREFDNDWRVAGLCSAAWVRVLRLIGDRDVVLRPAVLRLTDHCRVDPSR